MLDTCQYSCLWEVQFLPSVPIQAFFLVCKYHSPVLQIMLLILDHLRYMTNIDIGRVLVVEILTRVSFNSLLHF